MAARQDPGFSVAVVQDASVFLDRDASVSKAIDLAREAAGKGARLVLFPEAFIPGYPRGLSFGALVGSRTPEGRGLFRRYAQNAVTVPGPEADLLAATAQELEIYLAVGVVERDAVTSGTLYCTLLLWGPDGTLLNLHRKLKPTASERLIWGEGDGAGLRAIPTDLGRIGGLICWENYMPLARAALYSVGVELYLAPTADARESWQATIRHIALEGRCYVLSCNQFVTKADYPGDLDEASLHEIAAAADPLSRGGSAIVGPLGEYVAGPLWDEAGILYGQIDPGAVTEARFDFDSVGHYSRPDLFDLAVNPMPALHQVLGSGVTGDMVSGGSPELLRALAESAEYIFGPLDDDDDWDLPDDLDPFFPPLPVLPATGTEKKGRRARRRRTRGRSDRGADINRRCEVCVSEVDLVEITKRYGAVEACAGVNLTIPDGEFVTLLGPSGCGKSTTLNMIAGLEEITAGEILMDGQRVNELTPYERDVAMVFQQYALYPHMTVAENIGFTMKLRRRPKAEIATRVSGVAELLELSPYLDRLPRELSGGQQQRVALGRAIIREPRVFLFDEPFSNLDAALRLKMRAEIKLLHSRLGVTSIFVTHDQEEALSISDRIAVMRQGRVEQYGTPEEVYARPTSTYVARFIGSPPMDILRGEIVSENGSSVYRVGAAAFPIPERTANALRAVASSPGPDLGVRSEHVLLTAPGDGVAATVQVVQPLGPSTVVTAVWAGGALTARVPGIAALLPGETVGLRLDPAGLLFFDRETGIRIGE